MNAPEVWWSPSLAEDLSQGGLIERTGPDLWHQENGLWHRLDELPADAVRLVPEVVACPARDSAGAPCLRTDPHGPDAHQAHPTIAERARAMGIKPSVAASEQIAALTGQPLSPPNTGQAATVAAPARLASAIRVHAELPEIIPTGDAVAHCAYLRARKALGTAIEVAADAIAAAVPDTGQARETGADWAARPRRFSPEDTLSVAERLGAAEPSGDTVQAPDVAGPLVAVRVGSPGSGYLVGPFTPAEAVAWRKANVTVPGMQWAIVPLLPDAARPTAEALLGTDTPEAGRG